MIVNQLKIILKQSTCDSIVTSTENVVPWLIKKNILKLEKSDHKCHSKNEIILSQWLIVAPHFLFCNL